MRANTSIATAVVRSLSFLQQKLDRPGVTHVLLVKKALDNFQAKHAAGAQLLAPYLKQMSRGVLWADCDWKNCNHYYHPKLERGLWLFSNAASECAFYYTSAVKEWRADRKERAALLLGAAAHLLQDVCVPFHTIPKILLGHRDFEEFAEVKALEYVDHGFPHDLSHRDVDTEVRNYALFSSQFLPLLLKEQSIVYHDVLRAIVPAALKNTEDLYTRFVSDIS